MHLNPTTCLCRYRPHLTIPVFMIVGGLVAPFHSAAAEPAASMRTAWTTSRVVGSPDPPPPFKVVRAFPHLKFEHPLLMARCPGSNRLFVGEQAGRLYSFADDPDAQADLFFDLPRELQTLDQLPGAQAVDAVYGLAFQPDFETNRHCFLCYTLKGPDSGQPNLVDGTRVSRFDVVGNDPPRIDPSTEEIILTFLQGGHNGGDLHFGPDGMLYISTGDAASPNPPDPFNTGQNVSDLLSSILRIDVNRRDEGRNYAVPADNPFVGREGARPEVWAYGFRNPWRMSFDRETGELFVGDVGWELWEMVHRIEKGGNYGWSAMEGPQPIRSDQVPPTPIHPALIELPHTIASSVTGGLVYRGQKFPELRGAYIFGDWETRRLWAARFDGDRTREMPEIAHPSVRIVAFADNHDGEIYFLDYDSGTVHTLERNDIGAGRSEFPTRLSQTGLFANVADQTPMAGVVPFSINSRQWQDGATAEHWAAFPGESSATLHAEARPIPGMVDWRRFRLHFPKGAVLVRTVSLGGRRIETQLLHFDGVDWHAYTYAWRDDQADADLVPADGAEREVGAGDQRRTWQFHSRTQCMSCHNIQSEFALAFQPEQLHRPGPDGRNQMVAFTETGLIRRADRNGAPLPPFDASSITRERRLVDPHDDSLPFEDRARAYLHANCGHCHCTGGGGTVPLRLQHPVSVREMLAVGVRPTRGDFALPEAEIIKPGDPCRSTLFFRMAKFGRDRMPHLGSEQPDEAGLQLMARWISGMDEGREPADITLVSEPFDQLLSQPRTALQLARRLGLGEFSGAERDAALSAAGRLPPGPIRDLFEGYLPVGERGVRKLGSNPRPGTILTLQGDSGRGETLFWSEAVRCGSCHRIGERGTPIGPDLSTIGSLRTRADLLESLLEPSRRIEPKYAAYAALTTSGVVVTGLLLQRDEQTVLLRDAQNKERALAATEIEELRPSLTSLMPDGQMAGLTPQEAADLLEYLATRN
jgi:putative heme-binding domain-containing protein